MKGATTTGSLAAAALAGLVNAAALSSSTLCAGTSYEQGGNWFCTAVDAIIYSNIGSTGTYQDVTAMDQDTGECTFGDVSYSGAIAPFNQPLSVHFRGPLNLNQFVVYSSSTTSSKKVKRDEVPAAHNHLQRHAKRQAGHMHHHNHAREPESQPEQLEKKDGHPTIWVTATIDNQVVSWVNNYWGPSSDAPVAAAATAAAATTPVGSNAQAKVTAGASSSSSSSAAPKASSSSSSSSGSTVSGDYSRIAYYDSSSGSAEGLTFLGNYGGQGSGKWTSKFGNTLSYVNAEGTGGASSATVLSNTTIPSGNEIVIMSDTSCDEAGDCGYVQPGSVAYAGFGGKGGVQVFLFEFSMPHESSGSADSSLTDAPAVWMLNARIPLVSQYSNCSCWHTGCGEADLFEVLASGDTKCKSTIHSNASGGDSNYFDRPVDSTIKAAAVYDESVGSLSIKILDASTDLANGITSDQVADWIDGTENDGSGLTTSLFAIA